MKLRNKKTGQIKEFALFDGKELQGGATLKSLVEEWEDYDKSIEEVVAARPVGKGIAFINGKMYEIDNNFSPPRITEMEEEE